MNTSQEHANKGATNIHDRQDEILWEMARKRASFKWNLRSYVIMNSFFIIIWYFTSGPASYYWPVWPMLGWGVGLAFHYYAAYHEHRFNLIEKEYGKLKSKQFNN